MRERVCRHYKALSRLPKMASRLQFLIKHIFFFAFKFLFFHWWTLSLCCLKMTFTTDQWTYHFCHIPCLTLAETGSDWLSEGWKCDSLRPKVWAAVCLRGSTCSYFLFFNLFRSESRTGKTQLILARAVLAFLAVFQIEHVCDIWKLILKKEVFVIF